MKEVGSVAINFWDANLIRIWSLDFFTASQPLVLYPGVGEPNCTNGPVCSNSASVLLERQEGLMLSHDFLKINIASLGKVDITAAIKTSQRRAGS